MRDNFNMTSSPKKKLDSNYELQYNQICVSARGGFAFKKMHTLLENKLESLNCENILEIGAHHGEHQKFVKHDYVKYVMCDLQLPNQEVVATLDLRTQFDVNDACDLKYADASFDRVISTCVIHHVDDPETAFLEMLRVTKVGGMITILIPTDPGLVYRIIKELTSGRRAKKFGLYSEMKLFHAREHRNHFSSLIVLLENVYSNQDLNTLSRRTRHHKL